MDLLSANTLQDSGTTNLVCQRTTPQNLQHPDVLQALINNSIAGLHFNTCQFCDLRSGSGRILRFGVFPFQNKIFQNATPFNLGDFYIGGMFSKTYSQTSVVLRLYIFLYTGYKYTESPHPEVTLKAIILIISGVLKAAFVHLGCMWPWNNYS